MSDVTPFGKSPSLQDADALGATDFFKRPNLEKADEVGELHRQGHNSPLEKAKKPHPTKPYITKAEFPYPHKFQIDHKTRHVFVTGEHDKGTNRVYSYMARNHHEASALHLDNTGKHRDPGMFNVASSGHHSHAIDYNFFKKKSTTVAGRVPRSFATENLAGNSK